MPNSLGDAVSPYLRSHSENPVDWQEWGADAFSRAAERGVPLLVSIGYSTCHWCHVMARESFSDPGIAAQLNAGFVAIKVDREEHPDVDSSYLAAAGAFTEQLGWPLNVFVTPDGRAFYAGTYWPPVPVNGHASFRQVLDAVTDAWQNRRDEVEQNAQVVAASLAGRVQESAGSLPTAEQWTRTVGELLGQEDTKFGGFGGAPKFPVAPVLGFLLARGEAGDADAAGLARRTLTAMAASDLRDRVEGGFFRYSTRRDWTDPHYERMLYDNAMLLRDYAALAGAGGTAVRSGALEIAAGIADFLRTGLGLPGGAFASAQDSESTVAGQRVEGGYYALDAAARALESPPALDEKVLTGWNSLAIGALAVAGARHDRPDWIAQARAAASYLVDRHVLADGSLLRASIGDRTSTAVATLEDYGMFAGALLDLSAATGEPEYAVLARLLVDACLTGGPTVFAAGSDPVLAAQGLALDVDPSEGAYPSGSSAMAGAAHDLYLLTADIRYENAAIAAMELFAPLALARPVSFGAALAVMVRLQTAPVQLVVVSDDPRSPLARAARRHASTGALVSVVTGEQATAFASAGFELFTGRTAVGGEPTAYLCRDFVCLLPLADVASLRSELEALSGWPL
ncbi:MAG: thioredoxin domain-containing protein [Burkholderiaceae bacterium]|nr:thioredoxin domain-containing protein [Microbacteriaceae bacterium]